MKFVKPLIALALLLSAQSVHADEAGRLREARGAKYLAQPPPVGTIETNRLLRIITLNVNREGAADAHPDRRK